MLDSSMVPSPITFGDTLGFLEVVRGVISVCILFAFKARIASNGLEASASRDCIDWIDSTSRIGSRGIVFKGVFYLMDLDEVD